MQIHLSTSDGVPIYLQIVNQVKYLAACGRLEPGTQLPSVRKLADQLLVNPNTIARAYRELESEGVLTTRPGAGVFVASDGSPLARREQLRILQDRVDQLLAEASHMQIDVETLVKLLRQRSRLTHPTSGESNHE